MPIPVGGGVGIGIGIGGVRAGIDSGAGFADRDDLDLMGLDAVELDFEIDPESLGFDVYVGACDCSSAGAGACSSIFEEVLLFPAPKLVWCSTAAIAIVNSSK